MARIRSIHPGLFTDEAFVSLTPFARLLFIGILTECDDRGAFEWKPLTLRMRILPADNADVGALLGELKEANVIRGYELDGRHYGAVRNFCRFQRPKKPNYVHPIDAEFSTYVALRASGSVPVLEKGENSPQMEEEEGEERKEKGEVAANAALSGNGKYQFEHGVVRLTPKDFSKWKEAFSYLDLGAELTALAPWAASQKDWFFAVSGALAKRNRDQKFRLEQAKQGGPARPLTPSGNPWPEGIT